MIGIVSRGPSCEIDTLVKIVKEKCNCVIAVNNSCKAGYGFLRDTVTPKQDNVFIPKRLRSSFDGDRYNIKTYHGKDMGLKNPPMKGGYLNKDYSTEAMALAHSINYYECDGKVMMLGFDYCQPVHRERLDDSHKELNRFNTMPTMATKKDDRSDEYKNRKRKMTLAISWMKENHDLTFINISPFTELPYTERIN